MTRTGLARASGGVALACLLAATVVSGLRPALDPGTAPMALTLVGCGFGILAAVLLRTLAPDPARRLRLAAGLTGGGALALLALELWAAGKPDGGADIGQGLVRLVAVAALVGGLIPAGARGTGRG